MSTQLRAFAIAFVVCTLAACGADKEDGTPQGGATGGVGGQAGGGAGGATGGAGGAGGGPPVGGASGGASGAGGIGGAGGAGAGGAGAGGSGGAGGAGGDGPELDAGTDADSEEDARIPGPSDELVGWATEEAHEVPTTTGGLGGEVVQVDSASELLEAASASEPLIIEISGTIAAANIEVASNKTLIGIGANARIEGGINIHGDEGDGARVQNVIVQNLSINGATSGADGDALLIYYADHVWVDHCDIFDGADGNLDIVHASDNVTVSWTIFRYTDAAPAPEHRFCNLIGHDDGVPEDEGLLNVTFHHNWWSEGVIERMPRVRYGKVHVFNNYFNAPGNNYAVRAAWESMVLIENNYFEGIMTPFEIYDDGASIVAEGNVFDDCSGDQDEAGSAFDPPYDYTLDDPMDVPALVQANAGPR